MLCKEKNSIKVHAANGDEFRILVIADIQDMKPLDSALQAKICLLIQECSPDLVVLLGDMIFGPFVFSEKKASEIIASILKPLTDKRIPFTLISGNHDMDSLVSFEKQMKMYKQSPYCLTPSISDRECPGSYSMIVYGNHDKPFAQLIFHDCGKTHLSIRGVQYSPVADDQKDYEEKLLKENMALPTFIFQHIPVPEINELLTYADEETEDTIKIKKLFHKTQYIKLKNHENGELGEKPCPPENNSGQFNQWTHNKNVKAAVFGHDHKNSFCGSVMGIELIQTSCAGFRWPCYGTDELRGGRLLEIKKDGSFKTEVLLYRKLETAGK